MTYTTSHTRISTQLMLLSLAKKLSSKLPNEIKITFEKISQRISPSQPEVSQRFREYSFCEYKKQFCASQCVLCIKKTHLKTVILLTEVKTFFIYFSKNIHRRFPFYLSSSLEKYVKIPILHFRRQITEQYFCKFKIHLPPAPMSPISTFFLQSITYSSLIC